MTKTFFIDFFTGNSPCLFIEMDLNSALPRNTQVLLRIIQINGTPIYLLQYHCMAETIFSKIINGDIPAHVIYEDESVIAFLDIHPISEGHTLVIPKLATPTVWELPKEDYESLMYTVKQLADSLKMALHKKYVGMQIIGVDVPHAHVHLIPFDTAEEFHRHPDMTQKPNNEALAALAERIQKQV